MQKLPAISEYQSLENNHMLTEPLLYLSSANAGWDGLEAQAFHEPARWEGWISSVQSDVSLILFSGGVMQIGQRHVSGPWQTENLFPGSFILWPEERGSYELHWNVLSRAPVQTLHLNISRELIARMLAEGEISPHVELATRFGFQDPLLAQVGFALWRELEQDAPAGKLYAQSAARLLVAHLLRHYGGSSSVRKESARGLTPQQMRRIMDFVQANLSQDLSLEALARQAGLSPYHFARLFRQTSGESPHQFVLGQRIARARQLLETRDLPVAQIALESGFADQSHFSQVFKRQLGLTPRAYRLNHLR